MDSWVEELDEAKHKVHFASSPIGWTNDDLGYEWLTTVFDRYTKQKPDKVEIIACSFLMGMGVISICGFLISIMSIASLL
jgi:gluconate kinase